MELEAKQSEILLSASLGLCQFQLPANLSLHLDAWLKSIYKGYTLPLPGICLDLLGIILKWPPSPLVQKDLEMFSAYREHMLLDFRFSEECKRVQELAFSLKRHPEREILFCQRFLQLFFERMQGRWELGINPAQFRDLIKSELEPEMGTDIVLSEPLWMPFLDPKAVVEAYLALKPMVQEEDLWELAELNQLPDDALRYAAKSCRAHLNMISKKEIDLRRRLRQELISLFVEEQKSIGTYPVGGITGVSVKGHLESLVPSELMFMDEEVFEGLDLFDVRYLEQELLYYERDDQTTEDELIPLNVFIHTMSPWPGLKASQRRQPFFLYACVYWAFMELITLSPGYRFQFCLRIEADDEGSDLIKVALAFFAPLIEKRILNIETFKRYSADPLLLRQVHIGREERRHLSILASGTDFELLTADRRKLGFSQEKQFWDFLVAFLRELYRMSR
ncbi:MAG: hypothetical protein H3C47_11575 [Candidatus Cloacimonetes bacterium]|nr:hypothetical protein [Candidatus Cloacimonadota bacterium]